MKNNLKSSIKLLNILYSIKISENDNCNRFIFQTCIFCVFIFSFVYTLQSQNNDNQGYFFGLGYRYLMVEHNTNIRGLSSNPICCIDNLSGSGNTDDFNFDFIFKGKHNINYGLKIGYASNKSNLFTYEKEKINVNGNLYNGEFKHSLDIDYNSYNLGIFYPYFPTDNLYITLGTDIQYLNEINYRQKEEITYPIDKGVFQDTQTRTRNIFSGKAENINKIQYQIESTIVILLPLNRKKSFYLAPHLVFAYRFSDLINQADWTDWSYGIGLNFKYRFSN